MVTAGVYMVCRLAFLYDAAPIASAVIAWTGGLTAFFAATIAITQTDIKKVLAYSTVSQLGYMFLAAGCGGYTGAVFHLVTHAFFKALLFLAAGSVILAMHHEQDIEKMGGLKRHIPMTHLVFFIGVYAISGFPPFAGFFSKDEILVTAYAAHVPGHLVLYGLGVATAGITSFYMWRLYYKTFRGESRVPAQTLEHVHEPAATVVNPLFVLAFLSAVGGIIGIPQLFGDPFDFDDIHSLNNFLSPVWPVTEGHHIAHSTEALMMLGAIGVALVGLLLARHFYLHHPEKPAKVAASVSGLYTLLREKYYVDELYDAVIVRPLVRLSDVVLFRFVDAGVIDGIANGTATTVRGIAAHGLRRFQSGLAQGYVASMLIGTGAILWWWLR
jgi:NADH-quinone oxidoreductase subunit L